MVDWITTKIPSTPRRASPVTTLSLRTIVRNDAAVFSGCYGAITRQARQAGCSRETVYQHARQVERRLGPIEPATPPAEVPTTAPAIVIDGPTRRRLAVTAFAMGISTRQIEDLLGVLAPEDGPDHSTIARWVKDEAEKAQAALRSLDAACVPEVTTLAIDEVFWAAGPPWWASSLRA